MALKQRDLLGYDLINRRESDPAKGVIPPVGRLGRAGLPERGGAFADRLDASPIQLRRDPARAD